MSSQLQRKIRAAGIADEDTFAAVNGFRNHNVASYFDGLGTRMLFRTHYGPDADFYRRSLRPIAHSFKSTSLAWPPDKDFKSIVFGQIDSFDAGTRLGALGNHWPGCPEMGTRPMCNFAPTRDILALRQPTALPGQESAILNHMWEQQMGVLESIINFDKCMDEASGWKFHVKPFYSTPEGPPSQRSVLLPFDRKYTLPEGLNFPELLAESVPVISREERNPVRYRPEEPYKLGALYDPRCQDDYDYGGRIFSKHRRLLKQQHVRDIHGKLVPPWNYPSVLRRGAIVAATVRPTVNIDSNNIKIYRLVIDAVRVVGLSTETPPHLVKHCGYPTPRQRSHIRHLRSQRVRRSAGATGRTNSLKYNYGTSQSSIRSSARLRAKREVLGV